MDLTLSEEQRLIVDTVRAFVEKELYPHEGEVERRDEVPPELAGQFRAKAIGRGGAGDHAGDRGHRRGRGVPDHAR
jgi:acyl-CoA dehydrogenase